MCSCNMQENAGVWICRRTMRLEPKTTREDDLQKSYKKHEFSLIHVAQPRLRMCPDGSVCPVNVRVYSLRQRS